ncbi:tripartite tricarboxylate transporter permease [Jannaschia donghaensis]|uniref:Tripartite tricarboxylate transporter TctA family protein n=1 Tax=Jannaschia donghaensis TaxID=420998 RepID=A0A0M6YGC2_9RHOB|nr:tripartite tricarboxylate transporter permease [Jannaschia donghaensis]CTQ48317.1 Tripartite tricarboxylate transporter TctA family protein [Jannaschia donghaensis]
MDIFLGLATVLSSPILLGWIVLAAFVGMLVGAIPGLTASAAIAMLLPITFQMEPLAALAFLYVIGKSGRYGGSIAAILFNTPGTAASAATQIDGYPLARQGKAGKAMKVATLSSVLGDFTGDILLIAFVGGIAWVALRLGPPELFGIYVAAFVVIGSVIGASPARGIASAALGVLLATVGFDPITGTARMTFGLYDLTGGLNLVPLMIGMFVVSEVMDQVARPTAAPEVVETAPGRDGLTWAEYRPCLPHVARSSLIGAFIGMLPGLGSAIAAFVAYGEGKRRARDPEAWGKGALEGIAAPEAANNAVSGPSMAPLLTLGIPGSTIGAILVGAFLVHGIQIGPTLFLTNRDLVYALFACGLVGIVCYGIIGYFGAASLGRVVARVPGTVLYPIVFLLALTAAYSARGNLFDVWVALGAGAVGYIMRRTGLNPAAFVIAFVLTPGAEQALRQSLLLSDAGWGIFAQRPVAAGFLLLSVAVLVLRVRRVRRARRGIAA